MSADTDRNAGVDPSTEIEGFHDRLRQIYEASQEDEWNEVVEMLDGAKSVALKRRSELAKKGEIDV